MEGSRGTGTLDPPGLFVSYARADGEVCRQLVERLEHRDLRVWIDLEDIPPSAEWMHEIRGAIERSDGLLVVISPDLARSTVCAEELGFARTSGKRIVPVVIRGTDPSTVPAELAALNWIDATAGVDDRVVDRVTEALSTDLDHVRAHTRLLVRASEWERSGGDRGMLLRGNELSNAEATIAADVEPAPTTSQTRYVLASREAAARRQRTAVGIVAVALVLSLALTAFALVQRGEAIRQRDVAERRTLEANSRALASDALLQMEDRLDLGMLLALEAYRTAPTQQALEAMRVAAQRSIWIDAAYRDHSDGVNAVAVSPDGSLTASGSADGQVTVRSSADGRPVGAPIDADDDTVLTLTFVSDSTIATGGGSGTVRFFDAESGQEVRDPLTIAGGRVNTLAYAADQDVIVAGTSRGRIERWTLEEETALPSIEHGDGQIWGVAAHGRADLLVASSSDGELAAWRLSDGAHLADFALTVENAWGVDIAPDGQQVAVGTTSRRTQAATGDVFVFDVRTSEVVHRLEGHTDGAFDVAFAPDGRSLASASADTTVRLWDLETGDPISKPLLGHSDQVNGVAFRPDGRSLVSVGADRAVIAWDAVHRLAGNGGPVNQVVFAPDGATFATTEPIVYGASGNVGTGSVTVWDAAALEATAVHEDAGAYGIAYRSDGSTIVGTAVDPARFESTLTEWDATSLDQVRTGDGPRGFLTGVGASPDGLTVATGTLEGDVVLWDATALDVRAEPPPAHRDFLYSVVFSPTGHALVTSSLDGTVVVRDPETGEVIGEPLVDMEAAVYALAFQPETGRLAIGDFEGTLRIVDLDSRQELVRVELGAGVQSLAFTEDGSILAAGTTKGEIRLFDPADGMALGSPLPEQRDWINSLAFAPDGASLVSASEDGSILVVPSLAWTDDVGTLTDHLCAAAGRNLSPTELGTYVPGTAIEPTCSTEA